jgi:hypothetical protein
MITIAAHDLSEIATLNFTILAYLKSFAALRSDHEFTRALDQTRPLPLQTEHRPVP